MNELTPTASEDFEDWQFKYFVSRAFDGEGFVACAEVCKQYQVFCKLVSVQPHATALDIVDHMRARCMDWVDDWEARSHTGRTLPAPLN
jgi:hypothetical protein